MKRLLILGGLAGLTQCMPSGPGLTDSEDESSRFRVRTVAFYNVENLFDPVDDPLTDDDERTPEGEDRWTEARYRDKIGKIARVIASIGREQALRPPDLIGLCEVENRRVLDDLAGAPELSAVGYQAVHYDSPDFRGVDVALLYNPGHFIPLESESRRLLLYDPENRRRYTRDQLVVSGLLDGEPVCISVNHWPSRSGGETATAPYRRAAAALQRNILDSLLRQERDVRYILMGDLNDDPTDESVRYGLRTSIRTDSLPPDGFLNPMEPLFLSGLGTLAYADRWNLFDQILLNGNWFTGGGGYRYWKAGVFRPDYLLTREGNYTGYPFRTYAGGISQGGYSDHLPVYLLLIKKAD